ncbi:MAG: hypothetical protein ACJ74J_16505 [Blastocatellia bacterium]
MIRLVGILLGVVALTAYAMIEKRLNQRACPACAYRVSADNMSETCPRCGVSVNYPKMKQRRKTLSAR